MRVMLVNPRPLWDRLGPMERFSPAIPPLGVVWPATVLNAAGHETRVVDQHAAGWDNDRLVQEVCSFAPDLAGFSCLTFVMDGVTDAIEKLRARAPKVKIVLGNMHATLFHTQLLESGLADFVVRGEGERALPGLVEALCCASEPAEVPGVSARRGAEVHCGPEPREVDLDSLPYPDWKLVRGMHYEAFRLRRFDSGPLPPAVQASRGCRFNCRFCSQNIMYKGVRVRSVERVVDEIEFLNRTLGVTAVGFVDSNFPPDREYGMEFASLMKARGLGSRVKWFTEIRPDLVDEELIRECASAGMSLVQFGIESGDPQVLRSMGKTSGWDEPARAFEWCRKHGVLTVGLFVIGMPGETEQQIERTIQAALDLDPDLAKFSVATPYPGSELWHRYEDELKDAPPHKFSGWLDPVRGGPHLLERHTLPASVLGNAQRKAMRRFYLRPRKLAKLFGSGLMRKETLADGFMSVVHSVMDRALPASLRPANRHFPKTEG